MALTRFAAWLAVLGLCSACASETTPRTEIVVVIDSDLSVPDELDRLVIRVDGPGSKSAKSEAQLGSGEPVLPRNLGLVHESGATGPLEVLVEGRLGTQLVVSRMAVLSFVPGRTLLLPMHLVDRCREVLCADGQSCTESGCAATEVESRALDDWQGEKPTLMAGVLDAGGEDAELEDAEAPLQDSAVLADAGRDASQADAGGDAGMCVAQTEQCNMKDDDCDGRIDDGFNLQTNTNHCGMCNNRCFQRDTCCAGNCQRTCP